MRNLENAIDFYLNGFASINSTLNKVNNVYGARDGDNFQIPRREIDIDWATVIVGTIFTLLFWLISLSIALQDYTVFIITSNFIQSVIGAVIYAVQAIIVPMIVIIFIFGMIALLVHIFSNR